MILSTKEIPIKIITSYQEFVDNYIIAKTNRTEEAVEYLLAALSHQFDKWNSIFASEDFNKDITLLTLYKILKADNKPTGSISWKLSSYNSYLKNNYLTFKDHLIESFLRHLKKDTIVYKNYPNELKFFFYLSKEIKSFLFKIIRQILQQTKRDWHSNRNDFFFYAQKTSVCHIDYLCLSNIEKQNKLLYSALILHLQNPTNQSIDYRTYFKLSYKETKRLKEDLCRLIKLLQLNN